jgi:diacylglycerol kinase family enzyme
VASSLLIVNPFASNVTEELVARVRDALPDRPPVSLTQARGHAVELAREAVASGAGAIYVFSGDGGFNEVLNGVDRSTAVGFIPGGGTSVLPRALGLPRDPVAAA